MAENLPLAYQTKGPRWDVDTKTLPQEPLSPALQVYDQVKMYALVTNKKTEIRSFSLVKSGQSSSAVFQLDMGGLPLTVAALESIEIVVGGTVCGGSNILFTRRYELTPTGQVLTAFDDAPFPLRLLFNVELGSDQIEEPDDIALELDQTVELERLEIEIGDEWRKFLTLIENNDAQRNQLRPKLSWKNSFRLVRRLSSGDLSSLDAHNETMVSTEKPRLPKEVRKAIKACHEIKLRAPSGGQVYSRISLEPSSGHRERNTWTVAIPEPAQCSVRALLDLEIHRGCVVYRLAEARVRDDWLSRGQNFCKVHLCKSGLSWIIIRFNKSEDDQERLDKLMTGTMGVALADFLSVVDRSDVKCSVLGLGFSTFEVEEWFDSIGISSRHSDKEQR